MESYTENIQQFFKLPIEHIKHKTLDKNILNDLELTNNNIIHFLVDSSNTFLYDKLCKYYTTDTKFLKHMQKYLKKSKPLPLTKTDFLERWVSFTNETAFKEKYSYIEWEHLDFCNKSSDWMQIISVYNLMSPVISLMIPIIFLIFPFVLLKFVHKVPISFSSYKEILLKNMKNNIIGQFIREFSYGGNYDKKVYVLCGLGFYLFTIYQNALSCMKFYKNVSRIKQMLYETKNHIGHFINISDSFTTQTKNLRKFSPFNKETEQHREKLREFYNSLDFVDSDSFSWRDVNSFGKLLSTFYNLYDSVEYNKSLCYSFGYLEYMNILEQIKHQLQSKKINVCKFSKQKTILEKQYYLPHINEPHTKNTIHLTKNYIITGPNASGKTTLLKTTLINLILSQQLGVGCYDKAVIQPYDIILSYLNIPDTSDRDSLFQAEARRCLDILHKIGNQKRSICIFDELYSGTNPEEAVDAAYSYLSFVSKQNTTFLLTTHYYKLCSLEDTIPTIKNIHMESIRNKDGLIDFTYNIKDGISHVKGGINILKQLEYPQSILDNI